MPDRFVSLLGLHEILLVMMCLTDSSHYWAQNVIFTDLSLHWARMKFCWNCFCLTDLSHFWAHIYFVTEYTFNFVGNAVPK